ncbi:hypothetical protein CC80DRAFT_593462 [Byssothecium circinans]|uniref:Uncharacterized protein n=1 Tax=Byssothecium circinans TaxID=147558 RepID=A0A6A5U6M0_9PLEO|nr:hypothetical protein CC80DRAFT_593462 [Byssothecium circinans]
MKSFSQGVVFSYSHSFLLSFDLIHSITMRASILLALPLAVLAIPNPIPTEEKHEELLSPPSTSANIDISKREDFFPYVVDNKCRDKYDIHPKINRYDKMLTAVQTARDMVKEVLKEWWDEGKHGEVAAAYLGIPNDGKYKENEWAKRVQANLHNFALVDERVPFMSRKIDVRCDDVDGTCKKTIEGTSKNVAGYALNVRNLVSWEYIVVLCETWFLTDTPNEYVKEWKGQPKEEISLEFMDSDAGKMLHEFMHISLMSGDRPHIIDQKDENGRRRYTAPGISNWVKKGGKSEDLVQNADTYTQFVQAIYYKNKFGFLVPPVREAVIEEKLACGSGDDNSYVFKNQDKWIPEFCLKVSEEYTPGSEGTISATYDEGKPDEVRFRFLRRKANLLSAGDIKQNCLEALRQVFHNCETNTGFKHGGSYDYNSKRADGKLDFLYGFGFSGQRDRPWPIPSPLPSQCDVYNKFGYAEVWVPLPGNVLSVILQMVSFGVLSICLTRRIQHVVKWKKLPMATWLILAIYIDSTLFVFVTSIITRGIGINESQGVCEGGILLCLICYMTTKVLIYYFLVEKAYIIRGRRFPRMKSKLWLFNCLGMLLPYVILVVLNFIYRISYINDNGVCIIGMDKIAMLPLITFEVIVNVYLTLLFVIPLRRLYSYRNNTNHALRRVAYRSFVGSITTLISSVINLTVLMVLKGEPGWICLMCCNADILFSVLVLHWVTQIDRNDGLSSDHSRRISSFTNIGQQEVTSAIDHRLPPMIPAFPTASHSAQNNTDKVQIWSDGLRSHEPRNMRNGTMTTEIKAGGVGDMEHGRKSGSDDDSVELKGIRVDTERI